MEDEEDVNLYDDLLINEEEDRKEADKKKTEHIANLEKDNASLKARVQELETKNGSISKQNDILRRNISVLYKTAKAEIGRKDALLRELQRKYDEIIFRRTKTGTKFLDSCTRQWDSETKNVASSFQSEGNSTGKRKEPECESERNDLRPPKRPKVDQNVIESVIRKTCDESSNAKVANEGAIPSKSSHVNSIRHETSHKEKLSDKERTLAHFAAKIGRFNGNITAKPDDRHSDDFQVRNEKEKDGYRRKDDRRPLKMDNGTVSDKKPLKVSKLVASESEVHRKSNVSLFERDLSVNRLTKTLQKPFETSSKKRFERSSSPQSKYHIKGRVTRSENVKRRSRSRSPYKRDRRRSKDRSNISFNCHEDRRRR